MHENSEELGRLFVKNSSHGKTNYECRVTKFGIDKVFQAIEECVCVPLDAGRGDCRLEPFMVAVQVGNLASRKMAKTECSINTL